MRIGVLALQGAFVEHIDRLRDLDVEGFEIRNERDIRRPMDGFIIPGGESTVMNKLLRELNLFDPLLSLLRDRLPVFGTCAGLLLLAKSVSNLGVPGFATMDIAARRNAYGRQLGSFFAEADFVGLGRIPMTFIRAPYIESVDTGAGVKILAKTGGHIVAAIQGRQLVTAFHPELNANMSVHKFFLDEVVH
ncbi:MAG: pyridoxal 5'-phosphate synthase glutaminase subunit PdxT [Oscillospiraceae bacterium]|jgi:5'-phosphate synthase pdxT subunit|nr:pyridoxal 5'-phosphate synthase glutaminase subunit PdxT [Oscillospiraceae bacterium]